MMPTTQAMYDELHRTHGEINTLLENKRKEIARNINTAVQCGAEPVAVQDIVDETGHSPLLPYLIAKAQLLNGMAALKSADLISKTPVVRGR